MFFVNTGAFMVLKVNLSPPSNYANSIRPEIHFFSSGVQKSELSIGKNQNLKIYYFSKCSITISHFKRVVS